MHHCKMKIGATLIKMQLGKCIQVFFLVFILKLKSITNGIGLIANTSLPT